MSKIKRSNQDIVLAGVLGGLGEYFQINPDILRVAFVIIGIFSQQLFLLTVLYILGIFLMPKRPKDEFETNYTYSDYSEFKNTKYGEKFTSFKDSFKNISEDKIENSIKTEKNKKLLGYILVCIGILLLMKKLIFIHLEKGSLMAIALIIIGLFIVFRFDKRGVDGSEE
ncbi:MAG: PspC domain-containing protein [Andreesenia angusta]|nr:PspC domain-containing protein [Andreesenia angusta]